MVDALALGASGVTHGGSSPLPGTTKQGAERKSFGDFVVVPGRGLESQSKFREPAKQRGGADKICERRRTNY